MVDTLLPPEGAPVPIVDGMRIGRDAGCELRLPEESVSREHAAVRRGGSHWYLEDLGSRNGTVVDDARLNVGGRARLRHGSRIAVASVVLVASLPTSDVDDPDNTASIELRGVHRATTLSPYQLQVVRCLAAPWLSNGAEPASNAEIAESLGTPAAADAIKAALRRVYAKAGLADLPDGGKRRALCRAARERGWV